MRVLLGLCWATTGLVGCSKDDPATLDCGGGMHEEDGRCVVTEVVDPGGGDGPSDIDADGGDSDGESDDSGNTDSATPTGIDEDEDGVTVDDGDCDDTDPTLGAQTEDNDCDGLTDIDETLFGSDLTNPDTDGDWVMDGDDSLGERRPTTPEPITIELLEGDTVRLHLVHTPVHYAVDLAFMIQSTYGGEGPAMALVSEMDGIAESVGRDWPEYDWGFGAGTFADYAYESMGSALYGDKPFAVLQPIAADPTATAESLSGITVTGGGDAALSTLEGLQQALTGHGYDQNCDGTYDADTDLLPAVASSDDPFGGMAGGMLDDSEEGLGSEGSLGFRHGGRPIIFYMLDNVMRDPDLGDDSPGGCPGDATRSSVVTHVNAVAASLAGVMFSSWGSTEAMESLARATGSMGDIDDTPDTLEPLVFGWTDSSSALKETILHAIEVTLDATPVEPAPFSVTSVSVNAAGDEHSFVSHIGPNEFADLTPGPDAPQLRFVLTATGSVTAIAERQSFDGSHIRVTGPSGEQMGRLPLTFEVPATVAE